MKSPGFALVLAATVALATACNEAELSDAPPPNQAPVAVITADATEYSPLDTAVLDGSASYDPDSDIPGAIKNYQWEVIARPVGSVAPLQELGDKSSIFVDLAGTYTFGLTVTDAAGLKSEQTLYTFDAIPWQDIHIQLVWDRDLVDVDLHLLNQNQNAQLFEPPLDCFFGNMFPDWGPNGMLGNPSLDIDDVNGFGPENINVAEPEPGMTYKLAVHYYSDDHLGSTNATVRIYVNGKKLYEKVQPLDDTGRTWDVATISWPDGHITELGDLYWTHPLLF